MCNICTLHPRKSSLKVLIFHHYELDVIIAKTEYVLAIANVTMNRDGFNGEQQQKKSYSVKYLLIPEPHLMTYTLYVAL